MFRFTIRDLLWLMVVVGLGVALWLEHRQSRKWYYEYALWCDTAGDLATQYIERTGEQPGGAINGIPWERSGIYRTERTMEQIRRDATCAGKQP